MGAANFERAVKLVLKHEGGYINHPNDPGGPTNFGITLATYRKHVNPAADADDVRRMNIEHAKAIYRKSYWNALGCDQLPSGVDYAIFDYGVNSGTGRAYRVLRAVKEKGGSPSQQVNAICNERLSFLKGLGTWKTFGKGWARRVSEVRTVALAMAAETASGMPDKTAVEEVKIPEPKQPAKSKTIWAAIMAFLSTLLSSLGGADWKVWAVIIVGALMAFIIVDRVLKIRNYGL